MAPTVRVRDLRDAADAFPFLALDDIDPDRLPLPCRAARIPGALGPVGGVPPGIATVSARAATILAGPAAALTRAAALIPGPAGRELAASLERYDAPPGTLRFPGGTAWELDERSRLLGILNVTPDSFSDGGLHDTTDAALERAGAMLEEGADALDVGGESTRPGAAEIDAEEETRRAVPVIEAIVRRFPGALVSIDTRRSEVARRALDAGARMINDVSGAADPGMAPLAARAGCVLALMHMRGTPRTMQADTRYDDLIGCVVDRLAESLLAVRSHGVSGDRLLVDPGIGFGKSASGNELLLRQLDALRTLGKPILVGVSRKSFIGSRTGVNRPDARLPGSLAAAAAAVLAGARVIRAHDVGPTREALAVADAIARSGATARSGEPLP